MSTPHKDKPSLFSSDSVKEAFALREPSKCNKENIGKLLKREPCLMQTWVPLKYFPNQPLSQVSRLVIATLQTYFFNLQHGPINAMQPEGCKKFIGFYKGLLTK